jgi:ABC-2 type transport system permease protein
VSSTRLSPERAIAGRAFGDARVRTITFAVLFAAIAYIQPVTYRQTYPTLADRAGFANSFGDNKAIRLFYGQPHDLVTTTGYTAWRVGGTLAIFAAVWGLLAGVRALRAEEEAGRTELLLAGIVGRRAAYASALTGVAAGGLGLFLAAFAGLAAAGLPVGGSAYLALVLISVVAVFVGVGALTSQLAPTRRIATGLGVGVLVASFVLRVIADTSGALGWLRWATPLGWAEDLRPLTGARPVVLILPVASTVVLLGVAMRLAVGRDVGSGMLAARDTAEPRTRLLSSPTTQALRMDRGSLIVWVSGVGAFAAIIGLISSSISSAGISKSLQQQVAKLGSGSIVTPTGYLGFVFIFFILAVSLFTVAQVAGARDEEASQRLETLLALPVARGRWLGGRLVVASAGAVGISLAAGLLAWVGAAVVGVHVSFARMVEAGANCLPVGLLFLGIAAVAFAVVPRASTSLAYGIVSLAFVWDLFGALLGAPTWVVKLSPFEDVGLVPGGSFHAVGAIVMLGLAAGCVALAIGLFRRRDLVGA